VPITGVMANLLYVVLPNVETDFVLCYYKLLKVIMVIVSAVMF